MLGRQPSYGAIYVRIGGRHIYVAMLELTALICGYVRVDSPHTWLCYGRQPSSICACVSVGSLPRLGLASVICGDGKV